MSHVHFFHAQNPVRPAFSLLELLVVIAIIAVIAAMMLPALGNAGAKSHGIACLHNCRQLSTAYLMYAHDYGDVALGPWSTATQPAWVEGAGTGGESAIRASATFPYISSVRVFHCPADHVLVLDFATRKMVPRLPNYSLNAYMGAGYSPWAEPNIPPYKRHAKISDLTCPGPSAIFLFVDEHERTINDAHFCPFEDTRRYQGQRWLCAPSVRHGNAAGFAFADGHAEIHKWIDSEIQPHTGTAALRSAHGAFKAGPVDFAWMTNHLAALQLRF